MDDNFIDNLENIKIPTESQKQKEGWDVEGILKNRSNQNFKFDIRKWSKYGQLIGKKVKYKSKADKIVLEEKDNWIIIDCKEMKNFFKENKLKQITIEDLTSKLDWNIIIPKY